MFFCKIISFFLLIIINYAQTNPYLVGGPCEGCEGVLEFGNRVLSSEVTLPDYEQSDQKMKLTGTVYKSDGITPASGVIIYLYQTNAGGVYPKKGDEVGWARRHGYIRGWLKTDIDGNYTIYTLKPGSYPNRKAPAHIHSTILEPNGKYYYIKDFLFDDDPLLSDRDRNPVKPRGGNNGVLKLKKVDGIWVGIRNLILGANIPNYEG